MIYTQYIYYCITTGVHYSLHHNGNKVNWRGSLRKLVGVVALVCLVSYQDVGRKGVRQIQIQGTRMLPYYLKANY